MSSQLKVAAFTGGEAVPSGRFRVRQYVPELRRLGIQVDELPSRRGKYPPSSKVNRPLWIAATLCEQARNFATLGRYDVVLLQREIISKLVTFERWTYRPTVLDVDDAIFLFRDGYVAKRLAECAEAVVCGNAYLAEWFSRWNPNVRVIPTAIDTERYHPVERSATADAVVIGWIGTSSNLSEIAAIEDPLRIVLSRFPNTRLRVVCDRPPALPKVPAERVEYISWEEKTEVQCIQGMDIGIMPLRDCAWARGKCSFKLLQYMACGLASVVSAVGMNVEVAAMRDCSRAVQTADDWVEALTDLIRESNERRAIGAIAREVAVSAFSVSVLAPRLAEVIREAGVRGGKGVAGLTRGAG